MKIFYESRSKARANKGDNSVKDCKGNESINGSRWAVEIKR